MNTVMIGPGLNVLMWFNAVGFSLLIACALCRAFYLGLNETKVDDEFE